MRHSSTQANPPLQVAHQKYKVSIKQMITQPEVLYKVQYFVVVSGVSGDFVR